MATIIPAIIPKTFAHLDESLARVAFFADEVQIDIVDGVFVPFTSWPYGTHESISQLKDFSNDFRVEVDLMVENPEEIMSAYIEAGARKIVVHIESTKNLEKIFELKNELSFTLGLSILNDTPLEVLTDVLPRADYVQLMGIARIGSQGQPFDTRVIERIKEIKRLYPSMQVSIDGSVNTETAELLAHAGADRLVSGSAILSAESPREAFDALSKIARL